MKRSQLILICIIGLILASFTSKKKTGLKHAQKTLEGFCEFVPSGYSYVDGDTSSIQAFYMSATEITNLQYAEFLYDLLRKGEKDKYEIAKVDTNGWNSFVENASFEPMATHYHKHPAYHNYPVVNVSKEGAELFCEWLTEKYDSLSNGEMKLKFRLPYRSEWIRAANGGMTGATYSWGGPYLRNAKGCMLANFLSIGSENITRDEQTGQLRITHDIMSMQDDGAMCTASAKSYSPNDFGLYNMNGNVSELIADGNYAVGGDWYSPGYDIRNESIKEFKGPNPTVGFRVVTTFLGREIEQK
ncbi:MAG: SUMF1/EgtB/PvdO family nonheme iron enzyme [Flavobacteriales bacterium]|nr:SUMF1/EgtB/PvdO family nonheme iron enzyme [Flavobacteriales bacterium]